MAKKKSKTFAQIRHCFEYVMPTTGGRTKVVKAWAKVRYASRTVALPVEVADCAKSIRLKGAGDTRKCTMAQAADSHSSIFPHPYVGVIDFYPTRAFVATHNNRKTGLPDQCVVYEHNARDIAFQNDTPGGQKKLLRELRRDGTQIVMLKAHRKRSKPGRSGRGRRNTGVRARLNLRGPKLRHAWANHTQAA